MKKIMAWVEAILDGRPMKKTDHNWFYDHVGGQYVHRWIDRNGRRWMASGGPWSLFRVEISADTLGSEAKSFLLKRRSME